MHAIVKQILGLHEHFIAFFGEAIPEIYILRGPELFAISAHRLHGALAQDRGRVAKSDEFVRSDQFLNRLMGE
jgi:hypothetical protein